MNGVLYSYDPFLKLSWSPWQLLFQADGVYSSESGESKGSSSRSLRSSLSSLSGPGKDHPANNDRSHSLIDCMLSLPSPDHLRRIRTHHTGRSLVELTGEKEISVYLHKYFVFLLKAGGQRVIESVLEGPPQVRQSHDSSRHGN